MALEVAVSLLGIVILAIALVAGFIRAPRDWKGTRPILSSYVIVLIGVSLYILFPAILTVTSGAYTWAVDYYSEEAFAQTIWISVLALAAFLFGNALARRRHRYRPKGPDEYVAQSDGRFDQRLSGLILFTLLGVGLALKIVLVINTGGIADAIARMSGYAKDFSGIENFDAAAIQLRTISGVADGAATWGMLRALRERRWEKVWLIILILTLSLSYLTIAKRLILLLPILCVLVGVHVYRRSITTRILPLVLASAVGLGFLTLMVRVFLPGSVGGYDMNLDNIEYADGSILKFYLYSLEFASLEMVTVAMLSRQDIIDMFGSAWDATYVSNIEPFFYSMPRVLWPGKPSELYDFSYAISAELGATPFEDPTVGYASTLIGTSYIVAGIVGVMGAMFAMGLLTARIDFRLARQEWTDMSVILYALALVVVFHLFRQGSPGWAFIVGIVQQYGAIAALLLLGLTSRANRGSKSPPNTQELVSR